MRSPAGRNCTPHSDNSFLIDHSGLSSDYPTPDCRQHRNFEASITQHIVTFILHSRLHRRIAFLLRALEGSTASEPTDWNLNWCSTYNIAMFSTRSQSEGLGFASPAPGPAQARRCHILHLPNELLLEIMLRAAPWPEEVDGSDFYNLYTGRRALTLVCRRFNRIATPILYARLTPTLGRLVARNFFQTDIQIRTGDSDTGAAPRSLENAMRLLHRTMTANHSLRTLCRDLVFDLEDPHWGDFGFPQRGSDFAEWFTNTESLRFHDGFGAGSMPTILLFVALASTSMYRLKRLAFTARHKRLPVDYLFDAYLQMAIVRFPILRELQLVGLTGGDNMPLERLKVWATVHAIALARLRWPRVLIEAPECARKRPIH